MGKLKGTRVYLAGPMDRAIDRGKTWREYITPYLKQFGIIVLDPCDKPIETCLENDENIRKRHELKQQEKWDEIAKFKAIRSVDLRMIDVSDFIIVCLDMDSKPFGTCEEIVTANREKKPILVWSVQGKKEAPDWLFWMIPHKFIFNSIDDILLYLKNIDDGGEADKRWIIFNFS